MGFFSVFFLYPFCSVKQKTTISGLQGAEFLEPGISKILPWRVLSHWGDTEVVLWGCHRQARAGERTDFSHDSELDRQPGPVVAPQGYQLLQRARRRWEMTVLCCVHSFQLWETESLNSKDILSKPQSKYCQLTVLPEAIGDSRLQRNMRSFSGRLCTVFPVGCHLVPPSTKHIPPLPTSPVFLPIVGVSLGLEGGCFPP